MPTMAMSAQDEEANIEDLPRGPSSQSRPLTCWMNPATEVPNGGKCAA